MSGGSLREVGRMVGEAVADRVGRAAGRVQEATPLPADLLESEDAYLVVFDAPGANASDVQVRYRDGAVLVRVDRFRPFRDGFEMRFPGRGLSLDGRVDLPEDAHVDPEAASATLRDDGTLEVTLPKRDSGAVEESEVEPEQVSVEERRAVDQRDDADADEVGESDAETDEGSSDEGPADESPANEGSADEDSATGDSADDGHSGGSDEPEDDE